MLQKQLMGILTTDIQYAIQHLLKLSSVSFLVNLYSDPKTSVNDKRFALSLLLTIARRSRVPKQVREACMALHELGIVSENDLQYTSHFICECTGMTCMCMCIAYDSKIKEQCDQADPTKFWENQMFMWLLRLVENYVNEGRPKYIDELSPAMDEAFMEFRWSFFMLNFISFYDSRRSVKSLYELLKDFIINSDDTHKRMNPIYNVEKCDKEDYDTECRDCDGCDNCNTSDRMFLKEHRLRFMHIQTVLQQKLLTATQNDTMDIIQIMLVDVNDLNARLHL